MYSGIQLSVAIITSLLILTNISSIQTIYAHGGAEGPGHERFESITITQNVFAEEISDATTNLLSYDIQMGELAIMWLGNHQKGSLEGHASAGFLIKTNNHVIAIDPSSLLVDDIDSLDKLDVIFITHDHGDHFDPDTTIAMQTKTGSFVIADPTSASMLSGKMPEDKLIQIESNEQKTISEITVDAFAAEHPTKTPLMYVIEFDGFRIFHGSDSGFVEDLKNIEPRVHVAMVPAGDPSPTASPQVAFEMTKAINPYVVIPMHGSPQQIEEFSNLVKESDLQTTVTVLSQLEIIIPSEVVPEFGLTSIIVLSSGIGMTIYFLRNKNFIKI